jgi:hypothetical protein
MEWEFVMEAKDVDGPWEEWRGGVWTTTDELVCNPSNFDGKRRAIARRIVKEHNSHAALVEALRALLNHVDRETCVHESTHRGGAIWTICDGCGMEWADDRGGFVPHTDAVAVAQARATLALAGETP